MDEEQIIALVRKYGFDAHDVSELVELCNAAIESYKAELLKEVTSKDVLGEPVARTVDRDWISTGEGTWLGRIESHLPLDELKSLYQSDQVAAAIAKATKPLEEVKEALGEYICSAADSPSAVRRLVSAYQERNNSAAKYCSQLNEQDAELEQLRTQLTAAQEEIERYKASPTVETCRQMIESQAVKENKILFDQLAKAEQRVAEACPECGSTDTQWHCTQTTNSGVADGRLRMHDVSTLFYLGCNACSETIKTMSGDDVALLISANGASS